jgi:hypothetical protein
MIAASKAGRTLPAFDCLMEKIMRAGSNPARCAHCGNPFPVVEGRIQQWRVGHHYACNEFCAEGVEEKAQHAGKS